MKEERKINKLKGWKKGITSLCNKEQSKERNKERETLIQEIKTGRRHERIRKRKNSSVPECNYPKK